MNQENNSDNPQEVKAWYKQFWPWLVFSIPFLTVVAGIATYFIAANQPHSMVKDDYFKEGLAINQSIEKQKKAKSLGLIATLKTEAEAGLLSLKLESSAPISSKVEVVFSHPTKTSKDKVIKLSQLTQTEFVGELPELSPAYWYIRIHDDSDTWLLKSRWHVTESSEIVINALEP